MYNPNSITRIIRSKSATKKERTFCANCICDRGQNEYSADYAHPGCTTAVENRDPLYFAHLMATRKENLTIVSSEKASRSINRVKQVIKK